MTKEPDMQTRQISRSFCSSCPHTFSTRRLSKVGGAELAAGFFVKTRASILGHINPTFHSGSSNRGDFHAKPFVVSMWMKS